MQLELPFDPFEGLVEASQDTPPPDPAPTPASAPAPAPEPVEERAPRVRPPRPPMHERIAAEQAADPMRHTWVVAATVPIDHATARKASHRGSFRTEGGMRVEALEVYCSGCRRPLDEVRDDPCAAKEDNTHLIGGDPGVRAKRKVPEIKGVIKKQIIDRRGMAGYSVAQNR